MRYTVLLLLLCGCRQIKISAPMAPDPVLTEAAGYVDAIAAKMPLWDEDQLMARYEQAELATVKADIAVAKKTDRQEHFLNDVDKLRKDWDALVALDLMLQRSYVI